MRQTVMIAAAAAIGLSVLPAAPAAAMPVPTAIPVAGAAPAVDTVGYYGYGYRRYYRPYYYYGGPSYGYYYNSPRYYAPRYYYRPWWGYGYGRRWGY